MNRQKITTIVLCALFAAITAVLSQIAIPMPSGVPVTLQTFAIALCGFYLCTARATVSTVVYVLLGAVGVPVFSGFKGGIASIVGPTGGFIIGFIAMAAISGIAFRNMPEKFRIPLRIAMGISRRCRLPYLRICTVRSRCRQGSVIQLPARIRSLSYKGYSKRNSRILCRSRNFKGSEKNRLCSKRTGVIAINL